MPVSSLIVAWRSSSKSPLSFSCLTARQTASRFRQSWVAKPWCVTVINTLPVFHEWIFHKTAFSRGVR